MTAAIRAPLELSCRARAEIPAPVLDFLAAGTVALLAGPEAGRRAARRQLREIVRLAQVPLTPYTAARRAAPASGPSQATLASPVEAATS